MWEWYPCFPSVTGKVMIENVKARSFCRLQCSTYANRHFHGSWKQLIKNNLSLTKELDRQTQIPVLRSLWGPSSINNLLPTPVHKLLTEHQTSGTALPHVLEWPNYRTDSTPTATEASAQDWGNVWIIKKKKKNLSSNVRKWKMHPVLWEKPAEVVHASGCLPGGGGFLTCPPRRKTPGQTWDTLETLFRSAALGRTDRHTKCIPRARALEINLYCCCLISSPPPHFCETLSETVTYSPD